MGLIVSCGSLSCLVANNVPVRNIIVDVNAFCVIGKAKGIGNSVASLDLVLTEHMTI